MGKGKGRGIGIGRNAQKHSHYEFKRRCEFPGCKKRAKYLIKGKYYCKKYYKEV